MFLSKTISAHEGLMVTREEPTSADHTQPNAQQQTLGIRTFPQTPPARLATDANTFEIELKRFQEIESTDLAKSSLHGAS